MHGSTFTSIRAFPRRQLYLISEHSSSLPAKSIPNIGQSHSNHRNNSAQFARDIPAFPLAMQISCLIKCSMVLPSFKLVHPLPHAHRSNPSLGNGTGTHGSTIVLVGQSIFSMASIRFSNNVRRIVCIIKITTSPIWQSPFQMFCFSFIPYNFHDK